MAIPANARPNKTKEMRNNFMPQIYIFSDERNVKLKESVLSKGIPSEGKIGYVETSKQLKDKTLGEYLYTIQPKEGKSYSYSNTKIRNRVCTVEMYFKEIHLLWEKQSTIHPSLNEEVVTFWEAVERFKNNMPVYSQFNKDEGEVLAIMEINDLFLLGADKLDENLELESRVYLMKHLYRVQKLSTRYYEFRLAYKCVSTSLETPDYIRINGFGDRKTGWLKYNPV